MNINIKNKKVWIRINFLVWIFLFHFSGFTQDSSRVLSPVPIFTESDSVLRIAIISSSIPHFEISAKKMDILGAIDVGDALKFVPGVQLRDYGGIGGIKTVGYRGLSANHTSVQLDGQLLSNAQSGTINLTSFELFGLEKISFSSGQIVDSRSTASSYAQANTIALNSILASRPNAYRLGIYSNSTTINSFEKGFYAQSKLGNRFFIGAQGFIRFGSGEYDYTSPNAADLHQTRTNTRLLNYRFRSVLGYQTDLSSIILSVNYNNNTQELPGAAVLYNPSNDQKLWNEDLRLNLNHSYKRGKWALNSHLNYASNYTRYFDPFYLNLQGFVDARYQLNSGSTGFLLARSFRFPAERIFIGGDLSTMDLSGNQLSKSPFRLSQNSVIGGSTLLGKFRFDANLTSLVSVDQNNGVQETSYFKLSPFIAGSYAPFKKIALRIRAFYKNTYRLPTFNDLFYNFIGNPNLLPEDAQLFNGGITYGIKHKKITAEFSGDVYYNYITNKIIAIPTKDLFNWSMQNIGIAKIKGIDLSGILSYNWSRIGVQLSTNQSFNQSLDRTNLNGVTYGHQLPYTPAYTANYGVNISFREFVFSSNVLYSGFRFSLNENNYANLIPAFTDINLGLSKSFELKKNQFSIDLKAMNILNKNYEVIRSYPMPGRYFQLRIKYTIDK